MFLSTLKEYLSNSSLHGLRFIATEDRHWTERVFWIACIILSWYASGLLILSSWDAFQTNAISFVVDTTYNDWNTAFPSYTVCEKANADRVVDTAIRYWGNTSYDMNLEEILTQFAFYSGTSYFIQTFCFIGDKVNPEINCPQTELLKYAEEVRAPCHEVFHRCFWRNKEFDCCKYFLPVRTEYGRCYSINNFHAEGTQKASSWLDMVSNQTIGPGRMNLELKKAATGYITSREEVVTLNTPDSHVVVMDLRYTYHFWITIKEVMNEPEVRDVSAQQRKCRFPEENGLELFDKYSYGGCLLQCRKNSQLEFCGCVNHLTPKAKAHERCNLTGIVCLNNKYGQLSVLKNAWSKKVGLYCSCMDSCSNMEITVVYKNNHRVEEKFAFFELTLDQLPTERFKRIVVRGKLDLVVSMGGTTALFVGASLLSFVELVYYFTMRLYGNFITTTKKTQAAATEEPPESANDGVVVPRRKTEIYPSTNYWSSRSQLTGGIDRH